jgi:carbon storage regulator
MLVLSRKTGEELLIGDHIRLSVGKITRGAVKLAIVAPRSISVRRKEVADREADSTDRGGATDGHETE